MARPADRTVGLVLVALLLVAGLLAIPDPEVVSTDRRASTTRSSPSGTRALYLALDELGVPVAQRQSPLVDAGPVPGAFALVAPTEPASPREVGALVERVRAGGTLLYAPRADDALLDTLGLELVSWLAVAAGGEEPGLRELMVGRETAPGAGAAWEGVWIVESADHPWTRDLGEARGFRRAFTLTGEGPEPTPLLTADTLHFALTVPLGRGRVVALSDALPLTNEWIRVSGVAPLVVRAAAELTSEGDTLVFDEYHHGFRGGSVRGGMAAFLAGDPVGHGLLQLGAVLLLALLAAGHRFGAPLRRREAARSPLEHVDALARVYREAGARRLPRLHLLSALARHAGRPRPRDEDEARALLDRLRASVPGAGTELDRLEGALDGTDDDLLTVSAAVDRVNEELRR